MIVNKLSLPAKENAVQNKINEIIDNLGGGGGGTATDVQINGTSITANNVANIRTNGTYNASSNKIATMSDLPTVPTNISSFTNDSGYITGINSTDVTTALGYTPANKTLSNLSSTSSKNFDGNVVYKSVLILDGTPSAINTSTNLKSTGYLPNDNYQYEVFVSLRLRTLTTDVAASIGNVQSPQTDTTAGFIVTVRTNTNCRFGYQECWLPIDTDGIVYYQTNAKPNTGITIYILGYRRIGTNT